MSMMRMGVLYTIDREFHVLSFSIQENNYEKNSLINILLERSQENSELILLVYIQTDFSLFLNYIFEYQH